MNSGTYVQGGREIFTARSGGTGKEAIRFFSICHSTVVAQRGETRTFIGPEVSSDAGVHSKSASRRS